MPRHKKKTKPTKRNPVAVVLQSNLFHQRRILNKKKQSKKYPKDDDWVIQ